jgi:hypothetical protein
VQIRRQLECGGVEFVVVLQPDGSFASLPAWMTEPAASRFEICDKPHFQWPSGASPTLTSSGNGKDLLSFVYDGSVYAGTSALNYSSSGSSGGGGGGSQQIAFDYSSATQDGTGGSDIVLPFNVGSGSNRILIVSVVTSSNPSPDSIGGVSFNNASATLLSKVQYTSAQGPDELYLFALLAPTSGQHDIVVTHTSSGYAVVQAVSYTGVDQNIPTNVSTSTGAGITVSLPITVQNDGSWVAGAMGNNSTTMSFASPGFVREQINGARLQFDALGTAAQTQTFIANLNPPAVAPAWGGIAVELKHA